MDDPLPVILEPLLMPRPWGGRRLFERFGKGTPGAEPIGESWEIADMPAAQTRVRGGPYAGCTLRNLAARWGAPRDRPPAFPLLIKYLDARENLSIQVHPATDDDVPAALSSRMRPAALSGESDPPGTLAERVPSLGRRKDEAWVILAADETARLWLGLRPGVTLDDLRTAAGTERIVDLLAEHRPQPGDLYYVPGGTLHALGGGLLVAEVQTPSDTTWRLYDWGRVMPDGRPRELHVDAGLRSVQFTARPLALPAGRGAQALPRASLRADSFTIERAKLTASDRLSSVDSEAGDFEILLLLSGELSIGVNGQSLECRPGDTVLIPRSGRGPFALRGPEGTHVLRVTSPLPWLG